MDWTLEEVVVTIADYFEMLKVELSGERYNKSAHRRALLLFLNNRTHLAVEKKHQNISAVLIGLGLPYISGYKPLYNYQQLLKDQVENYLINHSEIFSLFESFVSKEIPEPSVKNILLSEVPKTDFGSVIKEPEVKFIQKDPRRNYHIKELQNSRLGTLGEKFIIDYEKQKFMSIGRPELARKVEHISKTVGDSAGFDILSFSEEGKEKYIEVKTTQMGKDTPFYFTRNELNFSRSNSDNYSLYRVFDFKRNPRFFRLSGSLDSSCGSIPATYIGWPS